MESREEVRFWFRLASQARLTCYINTRALSQTRNQCIKELKAKLLDTIIDVAEGQMGIRIRKKPVPKQPYLQPATGNGPSIQVGAPRQMTAL